MWLWKMACALVNRADGRLPHRKADAMCRLPKRPFQVPFTSMWALRLADRLRDTEQHCRRRLGTQRRRHVRFPSASAAKPNAPNTHWEPMP